MYCFNYIVRRYQNDSENLPKNFSKSTKLEPRMVAAATPVRAR